MTDSDDLYGDDDKIGTFKKWLEVNGAKYPKIEWPRLDTTGGVRGAVAIESIATNEAMIEIPGHLMMSPPVAFASDIGVYLRQNKDLLKTDLLLTVFIMSERRKGPKSFFHPFLRILPEPGTIANWPDKDLLLLQDEALHVRAKGRLILVQSTYNRTVVALNERHPDIFPLDQFSFENFKFCWFSIMARAFGKRLPWTALVPFADCLNHSNLQTKYDYDVNNNGLFRLFPTGGNNYAKGSEVFNSYGRRANDNLLLDYGFSMADNEWDSFEVMVCLPKTAPHYDLKKDILTTIGYSSSLCLAMNSKDMPLSALSFLRIVSLTGDELKYLLSTLPVPALLHDGNEEHSVFRRIASSTYKEDKRRCFNRILSVSNELCAVTSLLDILGQIVSARETSTEEDEKLLSVLTAPVLTTERTDVRIDVGTDVSTGARASVTDGVNPSQEGRQEGSKDSREEGGKEGGVEEEAQWRTQCAVTYRLTRKHIVDRSVQRLAALAFFYKGRMDRSVSSSSATSATSDSMSLFDLSGLTEGAGGAEERDGRGSGVDDDSPPSSSISPLSPFTPSSAPLTVDSLSPLSLSMQRIGLTGDESHAPHSDSDSKGTSNDDAKTEQKYQKETKGIKEIHLDDKSGFHKTISSQEKGKNEKNSVDKVPAIMKFPLKMTNSEREASVLRLELNLYIRQSNNVKLSILTVDSV